MITSAIGSENRVNKMPMSKDDVKTDGGVPRNRLIAGAAIFVTGQLAPLAIPLVVQSAMSTNWKTTLSGLLLLGVPEIAIVLTVVILGKPGFDALKSWLFGSMKDVLLPSKVSLRRYYFGLTLLLIPFFFGWASPYLFVTLPDLTRHQLTIGIIGDVTLIAGVCMMGGQFWDKLRALFAYDAEVTFSSAAGETTS